MPTTCTLPTLKEFVFARHKRRRHLLDRLIAERDALYREGAADERVVPVHALFRAIRQRMSTHKRGRLATDRDFRDAFDQAIETTRFMDRPMICAHDVICAT